MLNRLNYIEEYPQDYKNGLLNGTPAHDIIWDNIKSNLKFIIITKESIPNFDFDLYNTNDVNYYTKYISNKDANHNGFLILKYERESAYMVFFESEMSYVDFRKTFKLNREKGYIYGDSESVATHSNLVIHRFGVDELINLIGNVFCLNKFEGIYTNSTYKGRSIFYSYGKRLG